MGFLKTIRDEIENMNQIQSKGVQIDDNFNNLPKIRKKMKRKSIDCIFVVEPVLSPDIKITNFDLQRPESCNIPYFDDTVNYAIYLEAKKLSDDTETDIITHIESNGKEIISKKPELDLNAPQLCIDVFEDSVNHVKVLIKPMHLADSICVPTINVHYLYPPLLYIQGGKNFHMKWTIFGHIG